MNKMKTTVVYWGYIGIMEKKMETTIVYYSILGLYWDNGKELLPCRLLPVSCLLSAIIRI